MAEEEATQTAVIKISQASSSSETQAPPDPGAQPESTPLPAGLPQITLNYTAENVQDLPVYRATLGTPISVDKRYYRPTSWVAPWLKEV
jgi:hypothetical protein